MDIFPSQELQSSVRAGPEIRAGGLQQTEKCALQLVLDCLFSEKLRAMCCIGIVDRHEQLKSAEFKFENKVVNSRKLLGISRKLCLYYA
jgi:hypothetical protein